MKTRAPSVEPLESRIAPAAVFTYTDVDGDKVTIATSKGSNAELAAAGVLTFNNAADVPRQLQKIDLSLNPVFAGTDLSVTAKRIGPGGDGVTAVGFIDASANGGGTALNLGTVTIDGDLGRIRAGIDAQGSIGVKSLTVGSIGLLGLTTQAGGDLFSLINAQAGAITVKTTLASGVSFNVTPQGFGAQVGTLTIGGDLAGEFFAGPVKTILIRGDVDSGKLGVGEVGTLRVLGSIIGGDAIAEGRITTLKVGSIFIGGDIRAGTGNDTGTLVTNDGSVGSFILRGSLVANAAAGLFAGGIDLGSVGTASIGGSIESSLADTGFVFFENVKSIAIGGDLRGGEIQALDVGSFNLRGSMVGGFAADSGSFGAVTAKSIFVGGDLRAGQGDRSARIVAGTAAGAPITVRGSLLSEDGSGVNSASISIGDAGRILIGGDIIGVEDGTGRIDAGNVGSLFVGGDVLGGTSATAGTLRFTGSVGTADIRGHLVGGTADVITAIPVAFPGGQIEIAGDVKSFRLTGDVRGGAGDNTGIISIGGAAGSLFIGGNLIGNSFAAGSVGGGRVFVNGKIGAFTLDGDLIGDGTDSGRIITNTGFGSLRITGEIVGGEGDRSGAILGRTSGDNFLSSLFIGGSVRGGTGIDSGRLQLQNQGAPGSVFIRGDIRGGEGLRSGNVDIDDAISKVTIEGSVIGGIGEGSGTFDLDTENNAILSSVLIRGDIRGGIGIESGVVGLDSSFAIKSVVLLGSIVGGNDTGAGQLDIDTDVAAVLIGGSIVSGGATESGRLETEDAGTITLRGSLRGGNTPGAGQIETDAIKTLNIGGSIVGGNDDTAAIIIARGIGTFTVGGAITGNDAATVRIESRVGAADPQPHIAFGKITVGGSVSFARIHGGFTTLVIENDSDAQIGAVTVGGDWIASDLVAGATAGAGDRFGDGNDVVTPSANDDPNIFARIASITIAGRVRGTAVGGDSFGFVAQQIGAFKLAGETIPLLAGVSNDNVLVAATGDVRVREIA